MPERSVPYEPYMLDELQNDDFAVAYLNAAIETGDTKGLLVALRRIAEARGIGMSRLAKDSQINRQALYKILSENGNPAYTTLCALLDALGFELSVQKKARQSA